jgi:O-antigen/teichoic acid export membrane protein
MNFQTLNRQRKLILISAAIGIISIFLPWFSAGAFGFSVHINGFHGWGILAFLCFIASIVIALIGTQTEALDKSTWFAEIISGGVTLLCVIITMLSSGSSGFGFISAAFGFGIWVALAAAIGVTFFAWIFRNPSHDFKSGFESLKKTVSVSKDSHTVTSSPGTNKIAELERLSILKENGIITDTEFQELKSKLL